MFVGIARLARQGPVLAAKARVDYTELPARRYLNRCADERLPFEWTLNPYRGCEFGCKYCYARYTHEFMEYREPEAFERKIFAKQFDAGAFRTGLRRIDRRESIALGTATDPYQPAERRFLVTRRMLEVFAGESGYRLGITTKADLIARDAQLLAEIAHRNSLTVCMTVTTVDLRLARALEPMAPRPDLRLRAVSTLAGAGVAVAVFASPAMPGINDSRESLLRVARQAARHGARAFGALPLFLKPCAQRVFFPLVAERFPGLARSYRAQFSKHAYLPATYAAKLSGRVKEIRAETGLAGKAFDDAPLWQDPQLSLEW